jgi:hypothetical protein
MLTRSDRGTRELANAPRTKFIAGPDRLNSGFVAADCGSSRSLALVFVALFAATCVPVLARPVAPLADWISHITRLYAIADLDEARRLARYYHVVWHLIPNLASDLIVPPLARVVGLYAAGQIFLVLILALIASGAQAIHAALYGRASPAPLVVFLFLYNSQFLNGMVNTFFGIGVALWGVALWVWLRDDPSRAVVSTAIIIVLFFSHLFAVGLYGLTLLAYEIWRASSRPRAEWRLPAADFALFAAPFLLVVPLLAASPTVGNAGLTQWGWQTKLIGLGELIRQFYPAVDLAIGALLAAAALWAVRRRVASLHPAGRVLLALAVPVYIAMPSTLLGSWGADIRVPIAVLLVLVGFLRIEFRSRFARVGFLVLVMLLTLVRIGTVEWAWRGFDATIEAVRHSFEGLPVGSRLLVARADDVDVRRAMQRTMLVPVLGLIDCSCFVPLAYTDPGMQTFAVRPEYKRLSSRHNEDVPPTVAELLAVAREPAPSTEEGAYYAGWPNNFDYLYVLYSRSGRNPAPAELSGIFSGPGVQVYRILQRAATSVAPGL